MQHRRTPWKKSRTHGDIYGGRNHRRFADNIFERAHSIPAPGVNDVLPIVIEDNPSRDFFFPLSAEEVLKALNSLPKRDRDGITHIWLRRGSQREFVNGEQPLATFICGSGVRIITLYAWPRDMMLRFGPKKPSNRSKNSVERYGGTVKKMGGEWFGIFTVKTLRRFIIQNVLFHEVGHHVDRYYRRWSSGICKQVVEIADQYALEMTANAKRVIDRLDREDSPLRAD